MRTLGIDPGYDRLGIAIVESYNGNQTLIYSSCITTNRDDDFSVRLRAVLNSVETTITTHKPDTLALEKLFFASNQKTAMRVAEVRGALIALAAAYNLPVREYGPGEVKLAVTGYGKSAKRDIIKMIHLLLPTMETSTFDDEYDAVAIALTDAAHQR